MITEINKKGEQNKTVIETNKVNLNNIKQNKTNINNLFFIAIFEDEEELNKKLKEIDLKERSNLLNFLKDRKKELENCKNQKDLDFWISKNITFFGAIFLNNKVNFFNSEFEFLKSIINVKVNHFIEIVKFENKNNSSENKIKKNNNYNLH